MEAELLAVASHRAEQAEVYREELDCATVEFRSGRFHSQKTELTLGCGLRVVSNGKLGFAATSNPEQLGELVETALEAAAFGRRVCFEFPRTLSGPEVKALDNRAMLVSASRMIQWGRDLVDAMHAREPALKLDLTFTRTYRDIKILNSVGLEVGLQRAEFALQVTGLLVNDNLVWIPDHENLSNGQPLPLEPLADRLERKAKLAKRRATLQSGDYPVVIMPLALPSLLVPLHFGVSGKQREKGASPLIGMENQQLLDQKLTIVDNPLRDFGTETAAFDAEGVPRQRNVLFESGVFKGFLHDLSTAAACGCCTTASARRSYASQPEPAVSNLEIAPGAAEFDQVLGDVKAGLLVYGFIGAGQSNVTAGDIALNVSSGFKIESGKVVGRVKDAMVAGNLYRMLRDVSAVGTAQEDLGRYFLPFVVLPNVKVATRD